MGWVPPHCSGGAVRANEPGGAENGVECGELIPGTCSLERSVCVFPVTPVRLISSSSLWGHKSRQQTQGLVLINSGLGYRIRKCKVLWDLLPEPWRNSFCIS